MEGKKKRSREFTSRRIVEKHGIRLDLLIEDKIILELKSVDRLTTVHEAQLMSYLKLSRLKQGYLINFNVIRLKDGLKSIVM